MLTLLLVGLLLGMKHALDADHVAAVAALATRSTSFKDTVRQGVVWGAGHTLTLLAFAGVVLATDANIPKGTADALEFAVGVMLVLLGLDVLRRAYRQKTHFHVHRHAGGVVHFHAHSHADDPTPHGTGHHHHPHAKAFPLRALAVGMMHGMAGSAALLLLAGARRGVCIPGLAADRCVRCGVDARYGCAINTHRVTAARFSTLDRRIAPCSSMAGGSFNRRARRGGYGSDCRWKLTNCVLRSIK